MEDILRNLIRRTRSRTARGVLRAILGVLLLLGALEIATFAVGLFDPRNEDRKMITSWFSWLSHWPWWLTVFLLVIVVVALSAGQILDAFVRAGIIRNATPAHDGSALLSGEVKRFEVLDARNLTAEEFHELEEDFRRGTGMFYYIALVQITSRSPSRTFNWRFAVRSKAGHMVPFAPVTKQWRPPSSWPRINYCTLDDVANTYLKENQVYNVFLHLESTGGLASKIDFDSFEARFTDSSNREVVCTMAGASNNTKQSSGASGLRVEIARFESLQSGDPQYYSSSIKILDVVKNGATYVALLVLEASEHASAIAKRWSFNGRMKDGTRFPIRIVDYGLSPPPHWGKHLEPFNTVDGVRIAKGSLHPVYVHLGVKPQDVDPNWLAASFDDDSGRRQTIVFDGVAS